MTRRAEFSARRVAAWVALALAATLTACASGPDKPKPTPLEPLTPTIGARQVWKQRIGDVKFPLAVAAVGDAFTVASDNGTVASFNAQTGSALWQAEAGAKISAGVGSDGRFASVVTVNNELVTFDGGKPAWRKPLPSRVTTAPVVAGERVFVLALDRSVHAFDALDGRKLWSYQRPGDALTLAQPGVLAPFKDTLLVGQGPKLVGLDPLRGTPRWEVTVASPRGTNEVERLADLVAPVSRVGDVFCMRAFQAAVGCVNAERANLAWTRNVGGIDGVAADEQVVLAADASDRLTAWRREDGVSFWSDEKLLYRGLSAPLAVAKTFIVGDSEGMVHWLSRESGDALLRLPTDGSHIDVVPTKLGLTVLVVTRDGGLFAFRPE